MATTSIRSNDASVQVTLSTQVMFRPALGNKASWIVSTIWNEKREWVRLYSRDIDLLEAATGQSFERGKSFSLPYALCVELAEATPASYGTHARLAGIKALLTEKPVSIGDYRPGAVVHFRNGLDYVCLSYPVQYRTENVPVVYVIWHDGNVRRLPLNSVMITHVTPGNLTTAQQHRALDLHLNGTLKALKQAAINNGVFGGQEYWHRRDGLIVGNSAEYYDLPQPLADFQQRIETRLSEVEQFAWLFDLPAEPPCNGNCAKFVPFAQRGQVTR